MAVRVSSSASMQQSVQQFMPGYGYATGTGSGVYQQEDHHPGQYFYNVRAPMGQSSIQPVITNQPYWQGGYGPPAGMNFGAYPREEHQSRQAFYSGQSPVPLGQQPIQLAAITNYAYEDDASQAQRNAATYGHSNPGYDSSKSTGEAAKPDLKKEETVNARGCFGFWFTIIKRIFSAIFIVGDLVMDWITFADMAGVNVPETEIKQQYSHVSDSKKRSTINCDAGADTTDSLPGAYAVFCGLGTVFAIIQLVNMVGETIIEYNKISGANLKGFQILHGWTESFIALFLQDIPEIALLVFFANACTKAINPVKVIGGTVLSYMKNDVRKNTCKQKQKCCDCNGCMTDCCTIDCCCCCCFMETCCGDKPCQPQPYCSPTCCKSNSCCGDIEEDPRWALRLFDKGMRLYFILEVFLVLFTFSII